MLSTSKRWLRRSAGANSGGGTYAVEKSEDVDDTGDDTSLNDTEEDTNANKLLEVVDEGRADRDDSECQTEEGKPHGTDLLENQVGGNLADDVCRKKKSACCRVRRGAEGRTEDVEDHKGDVVLISGREGGEREKEGKEERHKLLEKEEGGRRKRGCGMRGWRRSGGILTWASRA